MTGALALESTDAPPVAPGDEEIVEAEAARLCGIGCGCDEQMAEHCEFSNGYDRCVRQQRAIAAALAARPILTRQSTRRTDEEVEREIERRGKINALKGGLENLGWFQALRWTLNKLTEATK